jgi:hypothetical protein
MKKKLQYKKVGRLNSNARIDIVYDKDGKAKVKWQYINKDRRRFSLLLSLIIGFIIVSVITYGILTIYFHYNPFSYLVDCNSSLISTNYTGNFGSFKHKNYTSIDYLNLSCINSLNKTLNFSVHYSSNDLGISQSWSEVSPYRKIYKKFLCIIIYAILMIFLLQKIVFFLEDHIKIKTKPKKKNVYDKIDMYLKERNAKDVHYKYRHVFKKCPPNNIIEIPVFQNQFLDYFAKGEFSDYLKRIEIREHPFSKMMKKGKKRRWVANAYIFYCKFYFSKHPKTGKLEVKWK